MGSVRVFGGSQSQLGGGGRIVLYEQFTGDGSDTTWQLTSSPANATWDIGAWAAGNIVTTLPLHVTGTAYKDIYDSLIWGVRNRVTVNNVDANGLVTLDYAPRSVNFYIFYWYALSAGEHISAYWRPEFIAKMEAPFLSDTSYGSHEQVTVVTSTPSALTTADAGKRFVANHASNAITFTLPSVGADDVGMVFKFTKINTGNMIIQTADSDTIADGNAGGLITESSALAYGTLNLVLVSATSWQFKDYPLGQWETSGP